MVNICVLLILISQPGIHFKFVKCWVYGYKTSNIQANGLSINAEPVLYIHLEEILDRLPAHIIQHQKYIPTPNTINIFHL